jgi:hypothetical protein
VKIETTIGSDSVLNNVDKIENFIVEQLKQLLDDYIVYPNYHSIVITPAD